MIKEEDPTPTIQTSKLLKVDSVHWLTGSTGTPSTLLLLVIILCVYHLQHGSLCAGVTKKDVVLARTMVLPETIRYGTFSNGPPNKFLLFRILEVLRNKYMQTQW